MPSENKLDEMLWPYGKPLPVEVVLSRGVDGRILQMPYNMLKKIIQKYTDDYIKSEVELGRIEARLLELDILERHTDKQIDWLTTTVSVSSLHQYIKDAKAELQSKLEVKEN